MPTRTKKPARTATSNRRKRSPAPAAAIENPVRRLRSDLGVDQGVMARLVGLSVRTVARHEADPDLVDLPREFREVRRLADGLLLIIRKAGLPAWIERPNEVLSGLKPLEVIERGEVDRIWKLIHNVGSGEPL